MASADSLRKGRPDEVARLFTASPAWGAWKNSWVETQAMDSSRRVDCATMFSVIVPTFNRPSQLLACLNSMSDFTYPAHLFEVIVIDDGSAIEVAPQLAANRFRFKLKVLRQKNAGPGAARNYGASQAEGRWLAFTDDDCCPSPDWLQQLQVSLEQSPDRLVAGDTRNRCTGNLYAAANQLLINGVCRWFSEFAVELLFFPSNNFACDRQLFLQLGGFHPSFILAAGEDRDFCMRWVKAGGKLTKQPAAVLQHAHPQGFTGFTKMHFRYGRGASMLHSRTPLTRMQRPRVSLYLHLLLDPLRQLPLGQALICIPLLAWSQLITALGFAFQHYGATSTATTSTGTSRALPAPHILPASSSPLFPSPSAPACSSVPTPRQCERVVSMHGYAQTFPQLLNQLLRERPDTDLAPITSAFACAMKLFSGALRASGKTFLAHVIGTASIVARHGGSSDMVATALLHAAYTHGDFGWRRPGDAANRRHLRGAVGERIEELVFRYSQLRWKDKTIASLASGAISQAEDDRAVLLIRLCNELEEHLDLGLVYCGEAKKGDYQVRQPQILAICRLLEQRTLADELALEFEKCEAARIPAALCNPTRQPATAFIVGASYWRSLPVAAIRAARKLLGRA